MPGSDPLALPCLDFQDPVFFCQEELQSGLIRNEVGYSDSNAPAGIHTECHPAGANVFPDCYGSGVRIVIDFLHGSGRRRSEPHRRIPAASQP